MGIKKVLFINYSYAYGSTGRLVQDIGDALEKQGVETYYACKKATAYHKNVYLIGNKVSNLSAGLYSRVSGLQGYGCLLQTHALINHIEKIKPDVIHLHNLHGNYLNIKVLFDYINQKNIKIVWTLHDCWPFTGNCAYFIQADKSECCKWKDGSDCRDCPDIKRYPPSWFFDRAFKMFRDKKALYDLSKIHIVTVSQWLEVKVRQSMLKDCDIRTIYNWIDLEKFCPSQKKYDTSRYSQKILVLSIASDWSVEKGIEDILGVAEELDDKVGFILVGNCDDKWKRNLSNVYYEGAGLRPNQISELYNMCDCLISLSKAETFGLTVAEALACDKPVIVRNAGACPEVMGECGVAVDEVTAASVWNAIQTILNGKFQSRNRAETYFSQKNIQQYIDLYRDI